MAFKELKPKDWQQELDDGLKYRKRYGLEDSWPTLEAMFYGVHDTNKDNGPNLLASNGDTMMSTLTIGNPKITVKPTRPGGMEKAMILESLGDLFERSLKIQREVATASLHAFLWGRGILKIGYDSEWGWDASQEILMEGEGLGMSLSQFHKSGRRIEFDSRVRPGMPWVKSVLPHDIIIPWGVRDIDDAPWVAHRIVRHIDDVKADVKYTTRDLQPVMSMEDYVGSYTATQQLWRVDDTFGQLFKRKAEYVEMYEIHDKRTGKIYVIATGHKKFLRNDDDLLQLGSGLPFVSFSFLPITRCFWTTPDAYMLKDFQAEQGDMTAQAAKHRRLSILKFLYGEDAISDTELEKALSSDVGVGVKVKGGNALSDAIQPFQPPNMNQGMALDMENSRRNAREAIGLSRNQMGEFDSSGRRTAREAGIVQAASNQRMSRRQVAIRDTHVELMRKLSEIVFEYWHTSRWIEVLGEDGQRTWQEFVGSSLRGDYEFEVAFGNEDPLSTERRQSQVWQMYQAFMNDPQVDQVELRKKVIEAFGVANVGSLFMGGQTPQGAGNANLPVQMQNMPGNGGQLPPQPQG